VLPPLGGTNHGRRTITYLLQMNGERREKKPWEGPSEGGIRRAINRPSGAVLKRRRKKVCGQGRRQFRRDNDARKETKKGPR